MTHRFFRRLLSRRDQYGVAAVLVAFAAAAIFMPLAAISVDVARIYVEGQRIQAAADAAATAGVTYLPNDLSTATATAITFSTRNGYPNSGTSTVAVGLGERDTQLKVTVTSRISNTFASAFGHPYVTVSRTAVADYNGPAPMGSPCNTFGNEPAGTAGAPPVASQLVTPQYATCSTNPQFWADIEGPDVQKTQGDRYNTRTCQGGGSGALSTYGEYGCASKAAGAKNTEFDPLGDFYVVHIGADAVNSPVTVQLYDPEYAYTNQDCSAGPTPAGRNGVALSNNWNPFTTTDAVSRYAQTASDGQPNTFCAGDSEFNSKSESSSTPVVTSFVMRQPTDSYNPTNGAAINTSTCAPTQYPGYHLSALSTDALRYLTNPTKAYDKKSNPYNSSYNAALARVFHEWVNFCTFTPTTAGDYYMQVRTNVPMGGQPSTADDSAWNTGNMAVASQTDDNTSVHGDTSNMFAIRANSMQAGAISVSGYDHMTIYANATGASSTFNLVRVIPAAAGETLALSFFDVGDAAGSGTLTILPPSDSTLTLNNCTGTGPQPKVTTTATLPACTVSNIDGSSTTSGWNGGLENISVPIPSTYTCQSTSPGGCWFRVQVTFDKGKAVHDTTTWTARIVGDPARLIQ